MESTGGINYTVCNLGSISVRSSDNKSSPDGMPNSTYGGVWTQYIDCYRANIDNPSVNSNGSVTHGSYTSYPAISTYEIK